MMKKICAVLLAVLLLSVCGFAQAQELPLTTITVQGSGVISAAPEIVTVTVNASRTAGTMLDAQLQVSEVVSSMTQKLLALGVLESDIVTGNYGYNPQYNYDGDVRRLIGYQANHSLSITCRDVLMLDSVIGAITDSGVSDIYDVNYDVADRSELYSKALELAVQAAERKAVTLATASGKTLIGLHSVTENQSYDARYAMKNTAFDEEAAGLNTGIRSGGVSVSASVTVVYEAQ